MTRQDRGKDEYPGDSKGFFLNNAKIDLQQEALSLKVRQAELPDVSVAANITTDIFSPKREELSLTTPQGL